MTANEQPRTPTLLGLQPLLERESELETLVAVVDAAQAGTGSFALVVEGLVRARRGQPDAAALLTQALEGIAACPPGGGTR